MRKTTIHNLKTWPEFYCEVAYGSKRFEVRKDDRDYQVGDILILREWDPRIEDYTGQTAAFKITYLLRNRPPFVPDGYVIMSLGSARAKGGTAND